MGGLVQCRDRLNEGVYTAIRSWLTDNRRTAKDHEDGQ